MASPALIRLGACDDFRVFSADGIVGRVEETWFGLLEEPLAVVVRLVDGRRGLLLATDVAAVSPEDESVTLTAGAQLLRLDPPHLEPGEDGAALSASWRASGGTIELPAPRSALRDLVSPAARTRRGERPVWQTIALLYVTLATIVTTVIALDFLIAYLVTGGPPY